MERIPPSKKYRKELEEILLRGIEEEESLSTILQKGMQIIMQELLEAEVTEFLERGHYQRAGRGMLKGYRNGYESRKIKTGEGIINIELPQTRNSAEPYRSRLKEFFRGNTECLQKLAAEMYARGLSTRDMVNRGLRVPLSITSDGAPGAIKAIEAMFPKSLRLRCWVHRMKNFANKVPPIKWPELKAEIKEIRDASSYRQGKKLAESFIEMHKREYPSLVFTLKEDLEALLSHLRLPVRHRRSVRTTNLVERNFVEERRRAKVIPGFLTEQSCLKLVFSVLIKVSKRWSRITMDDMELRQIYALRKELGLDANTQTDVKDELKEVVNA
jgi:transposase-like protein